MASIANQNGHKWLYFIPKWSLDIHTTINRRLIDTVIVDVDDIDGVTYKLRDIVTLYARCLWLSGDNGHNVLNNLVYILMFLPFSIYYLQRMDISGMNMNNIIVIGVILVGILPRCDLHRGGDIMNIGKINSHNTSFEYSQNWLIHDKRSCSGHKSI